jgi:DNA-binding FadR family transcriptional regulator
MQQVKRFSLTEQAVELLLGRIRAGEWPLGAKLPGETTLAPQLGVGRSTVREAIRQLAGQGVVQSRQGAGVFITSLDISEDWDLVLRRVDIVSVLEARIAIESSAASLAAVRRTPADLQLLRTTLAQRLVPGQSLSAHIDADMALHRAIVMAGHNEVLLELFNSFVPRVRQGMIDIFRIQPPVSADHDQAAHAMIVDAIADQRADDAALASRTHLDRVKAAFE